jgi:DNA-directed RNA polymerase specialized sigma24 family protein
MIYLHKHITRIPPEYRVVWELSFIRRYNHEEISGLLGIPPEMVKTKISKACMELLLLLFCALGSP